MQKLSMTRQQRDASVGVAALRSVFQVALDWASHGCQLAAYLVMSARVKTYLKYVVCVARGYEPVVEHRLLRVFHLVIVGVALVLLLVAHYPTDERGGVSLRLVLHYGPVCLVHLAPAEHLVESRQCFRRACEHHRPAHGTVEAMYYPEEDVPRLLVLHLDIVLYNVRERSVASLVALDDLSAFLVYYDNM